MKVRIGNDIRLKIRLPLTNNTEDPKPTNIISARAFFVNSTLEAEFKNKLAKKNRFIGRFPIEPFVDEFQPTAYNINCSGFPKYRAFVHNQYNGFGINPNWKECAPIKDVNITRYESQIEYTADRSKIIVTFPAEAQLYTGVYSLVVVGEIYDEGYRHNKRTVTVNTNNLFELVGNSEDQSDIDPDIIENSALLEIDNVDSDITPDDIYVVAGAYGNNNINLHRTDHGRVSVDVSPITSWYEGD